MLGTTMAPRLRRVALISRMGVNNIVISLYYDTSNPLITPTGNRKQFPISIIIFYMRAFFSTRYLVFEPSEDHHGIKGL